jgi:inner membrane protein
MTNQNENPSPQSTTPEAASPGTPQPASARSAAGRLAAGVRSQATGLKLLLIAGLCLAFLAPLAVLSGLTGERRERRDQAAAELAQAWAGELTVSSPVIVLPVEYRYTDSLGRPAFGTRHVLVAPESLELTGTLTPQVRQRGIFAIPLFTFDATLSGKFRRPSAAAFGTDVARVRWDRAAFLLPLGDYRALAESPVLGWDDAVFGLDNPRPDLEISGAALCADIPESAWTGEAAFSLKLACKGSDGVAIRSAAAATRVAIGSSWPSPSFFGSALPESREIGPSGMNATWRTVRLGQGSCFNAAYDNGRIFPSALPDGSGERFGFRLWQSNSVYQLTDRSIKYGILFIIIPFTALFLIEALRRCRVHPFQYLLIGVANCLFFLLLLALSEQISFVPSYLTAALVTTILAAWYSAQILPGRRDGLLMAGLLALLYGYMFTALQSEDYALLIGAVGLVLITAATMFATRRIDWYRLGKPAA